ncbi:MAG: RHS repeat protein [Holophaga sp.]|nr:RHS repeat protein [Holophaga sp.]
MTVGGLQITEFVYDAIGRLKQVKDAKNQLTDYFYDASNRIKTVTQHDGSENPQVRSWNYNSLGWLKAFVSRKAEQLGIRFHCDRAA